MVSRVPFTHFVSTLLRRRPFGHVVPILLAVVLGWLYAEQVVALVAWTYILSGSIGWAITWFKREPSEHQDEPLDAQQDVGSATGTHH